MIASSSGFKLGAIGLAIIVHVTFANSLAPDVTVAIESAQGASQAKLGSSFADMAKGVMTAQKVEAEAKPVETSEVTPTETSIEGTPTNIAPVETPTATPSQTQQASDIRPVDTLRVQPLVAPAVAVTQTAPTPPVATATATPSLDALALAVTPAEVEATKSEPSTVSTTITATAPETAAPPVSKLPVRRDPAKAPKVAVAKLEPAPVTKPKPTRAAKPKPQAQPKGNANQTATAGAATGQTQARAKVQGTRDGRAKANGNAAASNYRGKVLKRLSRVRKIRNQGRGAARVAFKIASNGGLAGVSLRSSSGSGVFDRAAMRAVQRAAPFPPPPSGAQRSFNILITGN